MALHATDAQQGSGAGLPICINESNRQAGCAALTCARRRPLCPQASLNEEAMRYWQNSSVPVLVQNAGSVDVVRVACAPRHAALITRKGELYTWGFGKSE